MSIRGIAWLLLIVATLIIVASSIVFNYWRWLVVFYGTSVVLTAHAFYEDDQQEKERSNENEQ